LGWVWSGYNLVMLGIALLILIDVPKRDRFDWFDLRRTVTIADLAPVDTAGDRFPDRLPDLYGVTVMLSEGGAEVALTTALPSPWRERMRWHQPTAIQIRILEADLTLSGQITEITQHQGFTSLRLQFQSHPDSNPAQALQQQRGLIEMLYCRPGQWKRWRSPGEWRSIGLLLRTILQPRVLRDRRDIRPTSVEKG
jgi:cellulose synthase (UDP-forming)